MNIYSQFAFVTAWVCFLLGIYVLKNDIKSRMNQVFFFLCMTLMMWAFGYIFIFVADDKETYWYWLRIASIGWCNFGGAFVHLTLLISNKKKLLNKWWIYLVLYLPGILFTIKQFTGILNIKDFIRVDGIFYEIPANDSIFTLLFILYYAGYLSLGILNMWRWRSNSNSNKEKLQAGIIINTTSLSLFIGAITNSLLPTLQIYIVPSIGCLVILVWVTGIWDAIYNHKLLTLTPEYASEEIISNIVNLTILTDVNGEIIKVNNVSKEMLDIDSKELLGRNIQDVFYQVPNMRNKIISKKTHQCHLRDSFEFDFITKSNGVVPINISYSSMFDKYNDCIGMVFIGQDLRMTRQLQEEIVEHKKTENVLRHRTFSLKNLLNNADQGFLYFGKDLKINEEYSEECKEIFGFEIEGKNFSQIIYPQLDEVDFNKMLFSRIFSEICPSKRNTYMSLLSEELIINNKNIELQYKIINENGSDINIMVILTNITEKRLLQNKMDEERKNLKMIVRVINQYEEFTNCINDYRKFCENGIFNIISSDIGFENIISKIYRTIHDFKGNFSQMDMVSTVDKIHDLENEINRIIIQKDGNIKELRELFTSNNMYDWINDDINAIEKYMGNQFFMKDNMVFVKREELKNIEKRILNLLPYAEGNSLIQDLKKLRYTPFRSLFKNYPDYLETISQKISKCTNKLEIQGGDFLVDTDMYYKIIKSFIHIFRNMIDHGIELPQERFEAGKEVYGNIYCDISNTDDNILIKIYDDGRGVDIEKIKKVAISQGIYSEDTIVKMSKDELLLLLFNERFTLAEKVTDLSGRGIGLAIVKRHIEKIGGRIEIKTNIGEGTEFLFIIPIIEPLQNPEIIPENIINSLANISIEVIASELFGELSEYTLSIIEKSDEIKFGKYTALINIRGFLNGVFLISFDEQMSKSINSLFIKRGIVNDDQSIEEIIAEYANVIFGKSIKEFSGIENDIIIDTPISISSNDACMKYLGTDLMTVKCRTNLGDFSINLFLR